MNEQQENDRSPEGSITIDRREGATLIPDYMTRTVRFYPIDETQLRWLTYFSYAATICFSFAAGLLTFAGERAWDWWTGQGKSGNAAAAFCTFAIFGVACVVAGIFFSWKSKSELDRIKAQSKSRSKDN